MDHALPFPLPVPAVPDEEESLGEGRPLSRGLLSCPQFGALRYLRRSEKRLTEAVGDLIAADYVIRSSVQHQGREYRTLQLTDAGASFLEGRG